MSVPKRWIDDGAPEPVRELLIAASGELPGEASAQRTLVALGVSGALSAGAAGAAGASVARGAASVAAAAKSSTTAGAISLALKWGFIGAVSAMAAAGVATIAFSRATPQAEVVSKPARAQPTASIRSPRATNAAPEEARAATSEVPPLPIVTAGPRTHAISAPATMPDRADIAPLKDETTGMMEEVSMIDQARAAVARGDAAAALATLDAYAARFEMRRFEPEALYLRMEALGRAGDREGRRRVAQRLLTAFPSSPQSERAREVLK